MTSQLNGMTGRLPWVLNSLPKLANLSEICKFQYVLSIAEASLVAFIAIMQSVTMRSKRIAKHNRIFSHLIEQMIATIIQTVKHRHNQARWEEGLNENLPHRQSQVYLFLSSIYRFQCQIMQFGLYANLVEFL